MNPARTLLTPLRHRDFRLFWAGAATSLLGDGVYLVALAWQAYTLTRDPAGLASLGLCATLSQLVALLLGGVVTDRLDRRLVMIGADLLRAATAVGIGALVLTGGARLWQLAVLSVIYGLGAGIAAPAFDALVPSLVPDGELEQANALDQFVRPVMFRMAGPVVGGVVVAAIGAGGAFVIDAATFAVSALCLALMRAPAPAAVDGEPSLFGEALAGIRFVRQRVWLWGTFAAATVAYLLFIGPTEVLLPYLVRQDLHGGAPDLGWVLAAGGVGALAAALVLGATGLPRRRITFMYLTWTAATLAVAGYGLATARWHLVVAAALVNGLEAAGTIAWATTKQRLVPAALLGRVSSLDWFISIAGLPVSYALTAPAAALLGARHALVLAGVLGAVATLAALFLPGMLAAEADGVAEPAAVAAGADLGRAAA